MKIKTLIVVLLLALTLVSCASRMATPSAAIPTTTPEIFVPLPAEQRAFEAVRGLLAAQLGIDPLKISLVSATPVEWPDSCLGVEIQGEACAQMVTPGFRLLVEAGGVQYEFHTNQAASSIRQLH